LTTAILIDTAIEHSADLVESRFKLKTIH